MKAAFKKISEWLLYRLVKSVYGVDVAHLEYQTGMTFARCVRNYEDNALDIMAEAALLGQRRAMSEKS